MPYQDTFHSMVHRRIGGLEIRRVTVDQLKRVHRRIGGLEKYRADNIGEDGGSPPHRRLRNDNTKTEQQ